MADTNKQLLPHRGGVDKMTQGAGKNIVLASGELFIEYPNAGAGRGKCKIKIGDGVTAYSSLPYAIGDTSTDPITFTQGAETTIDLALANLASGKKLQELIGTTKQLGNLVNTELITLNDENWYDDPDPNKSAHGVMLRADKTKLNGIQTGAEVNQNAFSTVSINSGSTTVNLQADSKTDKLTIKAGDNVTLTPDAASDTVTINAKDSVYTAGSGIDISSSNVIKQIKLSATTTSGNNNATTVQFGASFKVPKIKFDTNGHMVSSEDVTLTIPTVGDSDEKVAQQAATDNADLRVLLSMGATDAGQIDAVKKQKDLTYNPNSKNLKVVKINGVEVGSSPKFTDNDTQYTAGVGMTLTGTVFKAKMKQDTASSLASNDVSAVAGRQYAVTPDKNGVLSVNVPWVDENTRYYAGGGINLNNGTFSNAGVRSVTTGTAAGSIKVKTDDGDPVDVEVKDAKLAIKSISRNGLTFTATRLNGTTFTFDQKDDDTKYTASDGIKLNGTNFINTGVRAVIESTQNGKINVNTNGTTADVPIHGLGTAAYKTDSYFATSGHTHSAATTAANGFMSTTHVTKLNGIATGAEVNQNAIGKLELENNEYSLNSKTAMLSFKQGNNITMSMTPNTNYDRFELTINAVDTKYTASNGIYISSTNKISTVDVVTDVEDGPGNGQIAVHGRYDTGTGYTKYVKVGGLKSAAYTESSDYAAASHGHDGTYLKLSGGTLTGSVKMSEANLTFEKESTSSSGAIIQPVNNTNLWVGTAANPIYRLFVKPEGYISASGSYINFVCTGDTSNYHFFDKTLVGYTNSTIYCGNINANGTITIGGTIRPQVSITPIFLRSNSGAQITTYDGTSLADLGCKDVSASGKGSFGGNLSVAGTSTFSGALTCYNTITTNNTLYCKEIVSNSSNANFLFKHSGTVGVNICFIRSDVNNPTVKDDFQNVYAREFWGWAFVDRSQGSSRNYKTNIKDMDNSTAEKILSVNTVTFDFKEKYGGETNCKGVIAEDVEDIIPEAVSRKYDSALEEEVVLVNQTKFIPYLIKMVQIQNERINKLEQEINDLKK